MVSWWQQGRMKFTRGAKERAAYSKRSCEKGQDFLLEWLGVIHMDGLGCLRMEMAMADWIKAGARDVGVKA